MPVLSPGNLKINQLIRDFKDLIIWKKGLNHGMIFISPQDGKMPTRRQSNTVRLSPPAPNFGGVRFVKVPQNWGI
jgi:hypothetical protein